MSTGWEKIEVIVRALLNAFGSFLIGRVIFGQAVDEHLLTLILGFVMALGAFIWSFVEKDVAVEKREGIWRQLATAILAILAGWGMLNEQQVVQWSALIASLLPILLSLDARNKIRQLKTGRLSLGASGTRYGTTKSGVTTPVEPVGIIKTH